MLADIADFRHFLESRVIAPPVLLIIAGLLIFAVASLGCYGALRESPSLLMVVSRSAAFFFLFSIQGSVFLFFLFD